MAEDAIKRRLAAILAADVAGYSRLMGADGVYGDRIPSELVSNTSGIPGLDSLLLYGAHLCQFQFEAKDVEVITTTKPIDFFPA